ncbi:HD domain-containing phosphohydrolase [Dethiobacter alkaliphilus]|uniref:HD domain-containing phosphohydrolase n=1 Tax=Dethiobacter alkaliphilus TaxID=427926 RepID=UPI002227EEE3|nr:HD domain-containing phosphohydrolase [Dethiobacter alkaliphilus]MCW3489109.1 HD domain-containing protein [Dethiobacter alkaliphilus]
MREKWERLTIASKFSLLLAGVIILTGLITGSFIVRKSATAHREERVASLAVAAQMLAVHLDEYMSRLLLDLEHLEHVLAAVPTAEKGQVLESFFEKRNELEAVSYTDADGTLLLKGEWQGDLADTSENNGREFFLLPSAVTDMPVLTVNPSMTGLKAQVNLAELSREQKLFDIRLGESGHPYLLDSQGVIISHGQERFVGVRIDDLLTMPDGGPADVDLFTGATFTLLEYAMENEERLAGVVPLAELGLIVGFSYSLGEIEQPVLLLRQSIWLYVGVLTIAVLILAVLLGRMVTGPLSVLLKQLGQIEKGHTHSITGGGKSPEMSLIRGAVNRLVTGLHETSVSTVASLVLTLEARDSATKGHSQRVAKIASYIAETMGYGRKDINTLTRAALLHDLGKIAVPDGVLLKVSNLTEEERQIICRHPEVAKKMLAPLPFLQEEAEIIEQHHERTDGTGYPSGLNGEEIHPLAKILSVADAFEAMTANRPYRRALSYHEAQKRLVKGRDTQFDREVVDAFLKLVERRRNYYQGGDVYEFGNEGA